MAVMRCGLGAQEAGSIEHFRLETIFDLSLRHERQEARFTLNPHPAPVLTAIIRSSGRPSEPLLVAFWTQAPRAGWPAA